MNPHLPAAQKPAERRSAFDEALDALEPELHEFDISGFFGLGDKPLPKVGMRLAMKAEEDSAVQAAHDYVGKVAAGVEAVKTDGDIVNDAKTIEILYRICRDPADPKYPLFASPARMRLKLGTDQLAAMLNLYNGVRARDGGMLVDIDDDKIEAIADVLARGASTNLPEELLARMSREYLIQALVLISIKLQQARAALASAFPVPAPEPTGPGSLEVTLTPPAPAPETVST